MKYYAEGILVKSEAILIHFLPFFESNKLLESETSGRLTSTGLNAIHRFFLYPKEVHCFTALVPIVENRSCHISQDTMLKFTVFRISILSHQRGRTLQGSVRVNAEWIIFDIIKDEVFIDQLSNY